MKMRSFMPGVCLLLLFGMPLAHAGVENCPADNSHTTDPAKLKKIIEYKKSDHEMVAGYFRMWRDVAFVDNSKQKDLAHPEILTSSENKVTLTDIPDCLDMVMTFTEDNFATGGSASLKKAMIASYVPTLHKRGTKVIGSIWPDRLKEAYDEVNGANANKTELEKYDLAAQQIIAKNLTPFGFDGLDVDSENPWLHDATPYKQVLLAISERLHASGKLMVFDSNQYNSLLKSVGAKNFDYVLLQSYGSLNNRAFLQYVDAGIAPNRILLGFSFYEEGSGYGSNNWGDVKYEPKTGALSKGSHAYLWSQWEPGKGHKGGVFSYALDRDGVDLNSDNSLHDKLSATTFPVSRYLMTVMPVVASAQNSPKPWDCSMPFLKWFTPECKN